MARSVARAEKERAGWGFAQNGMYVVFIVSEFLQLQIRNRQITPGIRSGHEASLAR